VSLFAKFLEISKIAELGGEETTPYSGWMLKAAWAKPPPPDPPLLFPASLHMGVQK